LVAVVFRNCLAAALRAFARSGLYSAISVFGLAIGLGAAILVGLIARNETRYDHFLPGYGHIYLAGAMLIPTGHPVLFDAGTPSWISAAMAPRFAAIEAITRVSLQEVRLKHGGVEAQENIYWADPNVFDVLRFPTLAGNLQTALRQPDSIVVTRSAARKYFGRDAPLGAAILLNDAHPMRVTAVIAELPDHNTQFESGVFASGTSSYSRLTAVNFINLTTARAACRALEVGIRKASGAGRWPLIAQFLGESVLYTSIAAVLAIMGVELLLPTVNSFLQTGATFAWWREAAQMAWIATGALLLALLAGSYPALVLSAFRPVNVLKARSASRRPAHDAYRHFANHWSGAGFSLGLGP